MGQGPMVDVTQTAMLYSQVAGVLAGLTFTGLLLYLTTRHEPADHGKREREEALKDAREDATASSLFAAFTALTICAFIYAALAGGKSESGTGPAPTGLIVYGVVFGLAILAMFHAAFLLLVTYSPDLEGTISIARRSVYIFGPTIVMGLISLGAIYVARASCTQSCDFRDLSTSIKLSAIGTPLILVVSIISYYVYPSRSQSEHEPIEYKRWSVRPARFVLVISMLSPLAMIWLATLPADFQPSERIAIWIIVGAFLVLGAFLALTTASFAITGLSRRSQLVGPHSRGFRPPGFPPPSFPPYS